MLFTWPNLFAVGGIFPVITGLMEGAGVGSIAGGAAAGGLSQIGFSTCAYISIAGAFASMKYAAMTVSKEFREKVVKMKEYKTLMNEIYLTDDPKEFKEKMSQADKLAEELFPSISSNEAGDDDIKTQLSGISQQISNLAKLIQGKNIEQEAS